jgi:hypothetical protein
MSKFGERRTVEGTIFGVMEEQYDIVLLGERA